MCFELQIYFLSFRLIPRHIARWVSISIEWFLVSNKRSSWLKSSRATGKELAGKKTMVNESCLTFFSFFLVGALCYFHSKFFSISLPTLKIYLSCSRSTQKRSSAATTTVKKWGEIYFTFIITMKCRDNIIQSLSLSCEIRASWWMERVQPSGRVGASQPQLTISYGSLESH